jgi:hypothetical protein
MSNVLGGHGEWCLEEFWVAFDVGTVGREQALVESSE